MVKDYDSETGLALVEQRNKMTVGEEIEIFGPDMDFYKQKLEILLDENKEPIDSAPHPQQKIYIKTEKPVKANYILRKFK